MAFQKATIGTLLAITVLGAVAASLGLLASTKTISNTGNVKAIGVGVYSDGNCTNAVSSIDWGALDAGSTQNFTLYIKDEGTVAVTLNMTTNSWNPPSASGNMTLTWNRESYVLSPGANIQALLTLSVSPDVSGITSFSFNIVITGTEHP